MMTNDTRGKRNKIDKADDDTSIRNRLNELTKSFAKQNIHSVPAERLRAVAPEDRVESLYDVHGVLEPVEETPEFVNDKLSKLKSELNISQRGKNAFTLKGWSSPSFAALDQAVKQNPEFIESELIKFLRADAFDIDRATTRALKHFETKRLLFGPDVLGRNLRLSDLNEQERDALNRGGFQLLQKRDSRGRAILFQIVEVCWPIPIEMVRRMLFWSACISSRDEETQKRGLVTVHYGVNVSLPPAYMYPKLKLRGARLVELFPSLPVRFVAVHGCSNTGIVMDTFSLLTHVIESRYLCRIVTHYGSNTECRYNLMTFGIGVDVLPIDHEDKVDLTYHKIWLGQLAKEEDDIAIPRPFQVSSATIESSPTSIELGPMDVIMGKGLAGKNSRGNQMLKSLLEEYQSEYDTALTFVKGSIREQIYVDLRMRGCRFLAPSKTETNADGSRVWVEVGESEAMASIGHGFRNRRATRSTKEDVVFPDYSALRLRNPQSMLVDEIN